MFANNAASVRPRMTSVIVSQRTPSTSLLVILSRVPRWCAAEALMYELVQRCSSTRCPCEMDESSFTMRSIVSLLPMVSLWLSNSTKSRPSERLRAMPSCSSSDDAPDDGLGSSLIWRFRAIAREVTFPRRRRDEGRAGLRLSVGFPTWHRGQECGRRPDYQERRGRGSCPLSVGSGSTRRAEGSNSRDRVPEGRNRERQCPLPRRGTIHPTIDPGAGDARAPLARHHARTAPSRLGAADRRAPGAGRRRPDQC